MAIIKLGSIVQAISGTVGATNFVTAAKSIYVRKSRRKTSTASPLQISNQTTMQAISSSWSTLPNANRWAWGLAAKFYSHKNRLGISTKLTARQFFFHRNLSNLLVFDVPIQLSPPTMQQTLACAQWSFTNPAPNDIRIFNITRPTLVTLPTVYWISNPFTKSNPSHFKNWIFFSRQDTPLTGNNIYTQVAAITGPLALGQNLAFKVRPRYQNLLDGPESIATLTITNP